MTEWEASILETVPHDCTGEVEVGPRALVGLRRENFGLLRQRTEAITERQVRDRGWRIHFGADGMAARMTWAGPRGAEV